MIDIRPLNPARSGVDNPIGTFSDFEWRELIELAKEYGFEPPDIENYYPPQYDDPVEVNADSSWELWHAISAAHHDEAVPPSVPAALGRLRVEELMGCAQIGAEQGGIEIRRSKGAG
ncbi:MAG: hypothetical protein JOZ19_08630 [Rubrobacter sp.]|nr:hypothetical protein [Rubrobacter sp.]